MRKTTGISLILLIFLSLCLLTFSLLSLSGALADERLSQKAADRTTEYYAAVSAANEKLAEIVRTADADFISSLSDATDPCTLSFDVDVNETQQLHVVLVLYQPAADSDAALDRNTSAAALAPLYEVVEWKIVNTKEWHADQSQKLFRMAELLPSYHK